MQQLTYEQLEALKLPRPLIFTFDDKNSTTITVIERNGPQYNGWQAWPVAWHFQVPGNNYKERLAEYCSAKNLRSVIEFSPQYVSSTDNNEIFTAEPSTENLFKMASTYALREYIIIPENGLFQLISDGDYYTVYAGPEDFLSYVLECDTAQAMKKFEEYVASYKSD